MEKFNEQEFRLLLVEKSNYDLEKAEKLYNFIIGENPKEFSINEAKPDGIYFILSPSNAIHESLATDEDKHNCIAVGVKMGNRFANVLLHDAAGGEEIKLCQDNKVPCGSKQFFRKTLCEVMSDWDGETNTNVMYHALNPDINLGENEYIPSVAQLHLILLNLNEINKALVEAGGEPMKDSWYWSSTEFSRYKAWYVHFYNGFTHTYAKNLGVVVRLAVSCEI